MRVTWRNEPEIRSFRKKCGRGAVLLTETLFVTITMNPTTPLSSQDAASFCQPSPTPSRRRFLETGGQLAASSALAGVALPHVHAAAGDTIRLAIVGCGPRGSGAIRDALSSPHGPCKLIAMADLFEDKLQNAHKHLSLQFPDGVDVPAERQFIGFDSYKKAIDCLRPGDIALLTTRAAFRPAHFDYAVSKGVNVFMEKSFAADPGGIQQLLKASEIADQKGLKVSCGLQCRHSKARQELIAKMRAGEMGDIHLIRAYRLQRGGAMRPRQGDDNELLWQIRHPGAVIWVSAGTWLDNMIHQVDECCWIKDAWPVSAHGVGGRVPHSTDCSQNLDSYAIEYTFADGAKALVNGRFLANCYNDFATFAHGTKCAAQFSGMTHAATVQLYKDQRVEKDNIAWAAEAETASPWQAEWNDFLMAIRQNQPYNETKRAALANLAGIMGRAAVHSGQIITWEQATSSQFCFLPDQASVTADSPPPVKPDAEGRYPAPIPGKWTEV